MSLRDRALADAEVLGRGGFKLDRRKAMEKLARFQLEDPHQYVLELVAAAVCAGATRIVLRNDADDLELSWDGLHPDADAVEHLFDHVFSRGRDDTARMLHHLAVGLHGARGLQPRWIRMSRPGLDLDLTDPAAPIEAENDRTEGTFVHVRERLSWAVVAEALAPLADPRETALIRQRAWPCPIPIESTSGVIVGSAGSGPALPADRTLFDIEDERIVDPKAPPDPSRRDRLLWLARGEIDERRAVALVQDGVVVDSMLVQVGALRLVGAVPASGLRLNASRSSALRDFAWRAIERALRAAAVALMAADGARDPTCRDAAVRALLSWPGQSAPLEPIVHLTDDAGRRWSLSQLKARRRGAEGSDATPTGVLVVADAALVDAKLSAPQFVLPDWKPAADAQPPADVAALSPVDAERALLLVACGDALEDGTSLLKDRAAGRKRRARLAQRRLPPLSFGDRALAERRFLRRLSVDEQAVEVKGCVAAAVLRTADDVTRLLVELRVDGLPIEDIRIPLADDLRARVSCDALTPDSRFMRVQRDSVYQAVVALVKDEARALLAEVAATRSSEPRARRALLAWLDQESRAGDIDAVDLTLLGAPLFETLDGTRRSVTWLRDQPEIATVSADTAFDLDLLHRFAPDAARTAAGALTLSKSARGSLRRLLGDRLRDRTEELAAAMRAATRRLAPRVPAVIMELVDARAPLDLPDIKGEIGLLQATRGGDCLVRVIHEGVELGEVELPLDRPGTCAVVDWATAQPTPDWDGLADTDAARASLTDALADPLDALIVARCARISVDQTLPGWLTALLAHAPGHDRPVPDALQRLPIFTTLGGARRSLADVDTRGKTRFLTRHPKRSIAGFDDALVLDGPRLEILRRHLRRKRLVDVTDRIEATEQSWQDFMLRPTTPPRLGRGFVGVTDLRGSDLRGEVGVAADPTAEPRLTMRLLYLGRPLETDSSRFPVAATAVLEGDRIQAGRGARRLAEDVDRHALRASAARAAGQAIAATVADSLDGDRRTADAPTAVLRQILLALIQKPGELFLPPDQADALRARLVETPLLPLRSGGLCSPADARTHNADGSLRLVETGHTVTGLPAHRVWVEDGPVVAELLTALLGSPPPRGDDELSSVLTRRRRLSELPRVDLPCPGRWVATLQLAAEGAELWLGVSDGGPPGLQLDWLVDDRVVETRALPAAVPFKGRIRHPELKADAVFQRVVDGPLQARCQALVVEQLDTVMLALAELQPATRAVRVDVLRPLVARPLILRWARTARSPLWDGIPLLPCSDGRWLSRDGLRRLVASGKALRTVPPGTQGRTLDPERPALVVDDQLREALRQWAPTRDYSDRLPRDEEALRRREQPAVRPPDAADDAIALRCELARDGQLYVPRDGRAGVRIHHGWRPLCTLSPRGAVPLAGFLDDPALTPNDDFSWFADDDAGRLLEAALNAASRAALAPLLEAARSGSLPLDLELWPRVLQRSFDSARDVRKARNDAAALAALPVFDDDRGGRWSARALVDRSAASSDAEPRWVKRGAPVQSLPGRPPFVMVAEDQLDAMRRLLGGQDCSELAPRETLWALRGTRRGRLPPAGDKLLAEREGEDRGFRYRLGLARAFDTPQMLSWQVLGRPVIVASLDLWGCTGTIELPASCLDDDLHGARPTPEMRDAIGRLYQDLVTEAAPEIRDSMLLRWKLSTLLGRLGRAPSAVAAAWKEAPLLGTPTGVTSLAAALAGVAEQGRVLLADRPPAWGPVPVAERPLLVQDQRYERGLLDAAGIDAVERADAWLQQRRNARAVDAARAAAAASKRRQRRQRAALEAHLDTLLTGVRGRQSLRNAALDQLDALLEARPALAAVADPRGLAVIAWCLAESTLHEADRDADAAALGPRLQRLLADLPSPSRDKPPQAPDSTRDHG